MRLNMKWTSQKILGAILVLVALIGFVSVADEFRHMGELLGVCSILAAGLILLIAEAKLKIFQGIALQWISYCLILSIPLGGVVLDNMVMGISIGLCAGVALSCSLRKND